MVVANMARFLSVSVTELVVKVYCFRTLASGFLVGT